METTGRWIVTTEASEYVLDFDEATTRRLPGRGIPDPEFDTRIVELRKDEEAVPLHAVLHCEVGQPLVMLIVVRDDGTLTMRRTSPVVAVRKAATP